MARRKLLQTNFSAGEISPEIAMRQDTDQYQNGAKSLRNVRCLIAGGVKRRPGTRWLATLPQPPRLVKFVVNRDTRYLLAFSDGRVDFYREDGSAAGTSLTGCPWTSEIVSEMNWVQSGNTMFIVHQDMPVQIITRVTSSSWSRTAFAFFTGPAGRPEQPYLKLAGLAATLQPSGLTGAITLTSSSPAFSVSHIGGYVRYVGKACLVTGFISTQQVTATVVERLPETQTLTVTNSASFAVGEVVEGATSNAKGVVTGIPDATHLTVVIVQGLTPFQAENLTGPNAKTAISAVASATPAAVTDWDEQVFGPVYGYPSCIELHRNRLVLAGSPGAPDYVFGSSLNNLYDFNVGDGSDADGIAEPIGDAGASKVIGLHSAEQLLVITDRGPYYVPESATSPFRPSSMAFFPFGSPWPFNARARTASFDGGVLAISGSLVIKMRPTGDLSRAWDADEVSILASHMIDSPDAMAVTSNFGSGPERYAIIRNERGTLVVMQLVEAQKIRNFTPWDTSGEVLSVEAIDDHVYLVVQRTIGTAATFILEVMDQSVTLDAVTAFSDLSLVPARYGTTTVYVRVGNYNLGTYPLSLAPPSGPYEVGILFAPRIETLPPVIDGPYGAMAGEYMRITEALVDVIESARFSTDGLSLTAYQIGEDLTAAPPSRTGPQRFQFLGWERDPTLTITQADPLPLTIRSIKTEVAF